MKFLSQDNRAWLASLALKKSDWGKTMCINKLGFPMSKVSHNWCKKAENCNFEEWSLPQ